MQKIVYLNGQYAAADDAKISIFDRGLLFGDAIYEVIPVYQGRAFFVEQHLARLADSLKQIKMDCPAIDFSSLFTQLIEQNGGGDLQIYLQITRGNQNKRQHDIPLNLKPTVFAFTLHNSYPTPSQLKQGLKAELLEDYRWLRCDIKTTAMLANVLLNDEALASGAATALLTRDGYVTEGSASNVFIVDKNGLIKTPPLNSLCLPGITRQIVLDLLNKMNWPTAETPIAVQELFTAKEVWITGSTKEIFPVTAINHVKIGGGMAGDYWQQIYAAFKQLINDNL